MRAHRVLLLLGIVGLFAVAVPTPAPATFPGANGRIAYTAPGNGGVEDVWLADPTTGDNAVNVSDHPAVDYQPAVSPDGRRVAFVSTRGGSNSIHVSNTDGSGLAALTDDQGNDVTPAWSPDGTRLAFASDRAGIPGDFDLYVMNADGSGLTNLTNTPARVEGAPDWSPDGQQIALVHDVGGGTAGISIRRIADGQETLLANAGTYNIEPSFSPSGTQIAYESDASGNAEVYLVNADGSGGLTNLSNNPAYDGQPSFSPDGNWVAWFTDRDGDNDIAQMFNNGNNQQVIRRAGTSETDPSWGPSVAPVTPPAAAGQLAWTIVDGQDRDVWLGDAGGMNQRNLTTSTPSSVDEAPAVSPDGRQVAFTSDRDGDQEIFVWDVGQQSLAQVTDNTVVDALPAWSPDGNRLVFVSNLDDPGAFDLYFMDADGRNRTRWTTTPSVEELYPAWSPDGTAIAYVAQGAGTPPMVEIRSITAAAGTVIATGSQPTWSPDGARIAYELDAGGDSDIWVANSDGTGFAVNLTNDPATDLAPAWSPDGTRIAFSTDRFGQSLDIATMAADGTDVVPAYSGLLDNIDPHWGPAPAPQPAPGQLDPVTRLFGPERIATAVEIAGDLVPAGPVAAVVLARADNYPDALAGTPLAIGAGGPILLTNTDALPAATQGEMQRILPAGSPVYLLGGTAAISTQVEQQVQALGYQTIRIGGANRFATAVAIAEAFTAPQVLLLATGHSFQAALPSGVAATVNGGVVLLTADTTLPPETQQYLANHPTVPRFAIGPEAIAADPTATPIGGANPYEVSTNLAAVAFANPTRAALASGTVFPDGLTGGPHAALNGAPLLLTDPTALPASVRTYLTDHAATIDGLFAYGGTAAIADAVATDAQTAISTLP